MDIELELFLTEHFVFRTENDYFRAMGPGFIFGEQTETHDGQKIARLSEVRSRSVEKNYAVSPTGVDNIRLESLSICHVSDENPLIFFEFHQLGQISGDGKTAFVIDVGASDDSSMDLRFD
jgi:hypothetical protein